MLLIGLIGAPNKGKSTIFSSLTQMDVGIANYAFTTIKPNLGVTYATKKCADAALNVKCNPKNSFCRNGIRYLPVNVIDVAGLVPGAHLGKGMGNQFLDDLISADALIQVVDMSGKTDVNGNACQTSNPFEEIEMVRNEMSEWLAHIITGHMQKLSKRQDGDRAMIELLSGLKADINQIKTAAEANFLSLSNINWSYDNAKLFASSLLNVTKPTIVAANKMDIAAPESLKSLRSKMPGIEIVPCSGAIELALMKAEKANIINYTRGDADFRVVGTINREQETALEYIRRYLKSNGTTGIQELINNAVFKLLNNIVVYPVEDEASYSDHSGNVLPDAVLMKSGSTAYDLASRIHTEIAKGMKYAVDARTKMRLQKEYKLEDGDVIKIVTTR